MRVFVARVFAASLTTTSLASAAPSTATATQDTPVTLIVQRDGREVGRESLVLRDTRPKGVTGTTIESVARYPATQPTLRLSAAVERTPEPALALFQMDIDSAGAMTVIRAAGDGTRLTVRTASKGSEAGRQLPDGANIVLLDDAVFSLYAQVASLATSAGKSLTGFFPRTGRRVTFVARRDAGDTEIRVTLTGGIAGSLVTDLKGRLIRLEIPATQTVVTRGSE